MAIRILGVRVALEYERTRGNELVEILIWEKLRGLMFCCTRPDSRTHYAQTQVGA